MGTRQIATLDIQDELSRQGKCFIAFRSELDPIMRELTNDYLKAQGVPQRKKRQLVAHCLFSKSGVKFDNYAQYYDKDKV